LENIYNYGVTSKKESEMNRLQEDIEFTLDEISLALNIPKETCRQVLLKALQKLKSRENKPKLEEIYTELIALEKE
jgi:DNA-directed RNA polymerase sigma subunit (sigma70/sigma32)